MVEIDHKIIKAYALKNAVEHNENFNNFQAFNCLGEIDDRT
jgi:hypothetical protein